MRSATELVQGLAITWQVIEAGLAHWTVDDLNIPYRDTDENGEEEVFTLQWISGI